MEKVDSKQNQLLAVANNKIEGDYNQHVKDLTWSVETLPSDLQKLPKKHKELVVKWHNDAVYLLLMVHEREKRIALMDVELMQRRYEKQMFHSLTTKQKERI